ncbi:hypothetical protein CC2G_007702 [Coprinopsis cinerea AmutBmut pab1-1]|nr:hypothetical protein CC2G_007702 [Coprinopsis cinerea AmutBmut pab1-1]
MESNERNTGITSETKKRVLELWSNHPDVIWTPEGEPTIPADALKGVIHGFNPDGSSLMTPVEEAMLDALLRDNPGMNCTPTMILEFIAQRAKASPKESPENNDSDKPLPPPPEDAMQQHLLRDSPDQLDELDLTMTMTPSDHGGFSRPPSRGPPPTPSSAKTMFDTDRRQRSTPLTAPSSWTVKRPTPAARRKSDAGHRSDSDSGLPPSAFRRSTSRTGGSRSRAPSNPTSPMSSSNLDLNTFSPISSSSSFSRPPSRQHSASNSGAFASLHFGAPDDHGYSSSEDAIDYSSHHRAPNPSPERYPGDMNTVPIPREEGDSDDEESVLGLVHDRDYRPSDASMADYERLEALQKVNSDLQKKCMEAEEMLHRKVAEHEQDYIDWESQLEQLRAELSAAKREEKELRAKDRQNNTQIAALEQEVVRVTKLLEQSKATYTSLQRQYQEQCASSERYRNDLREREEYIRNLKETVALNDLDKERSEKERGLLEERITALELDLQNAQTVYTELEDQKQENLMLKETIDRMRFDMDELRHTLTTTSNSNSSASSTAGSISKSLGAELAGKLKEHSWEEEEEDDTGAESTASTDTLVIEEEELTEGEEEDVIRTIITRKKRKVPSKAIERYQHREFEEAKEYSDMGIQYDPTLFSISRTAQTMPEPKIIRASFSTQTELPPVVEFSVQTDVEEQPQKVTMEMEIQTDIPEEEEVSRSPSPTNAQLDSMASSESTIIPPTPRQVPNRTLGLDDEPSASSSSDQPPAYHDHNWTVVSDVLKKWHAGAKIPIPADGGVEGGAVSEDLVEEWKALKDELGVECMVIDKMIENSKVVPSTNGDGEGGRKGKNKRRSRFYNIYNTYVFGNDSSEGSSKPPTTISLVTSLATQAALIAGAGALVVLALTPYIAPHYSIPGGPVYYDRAAWTSFNTLSAAGEGFGFGLRGGYGGGDGTEAVWKVLGRVGGGAARMARGWPT